MNSENVRPCAPSEIATIWSVINEAAEAYRGRIPDDCFGEPYFPLEELHDEIHKGVEFWCCEENGGVIAGVMGIQRAQDVTLIRHAYVKVGEQGKGIGGRMLQHLLQLARGPVLIGTWKGADWAIRFYRRHGFHQVSEQEKDTLLRKYWTVGERQMQMSVVLRQTDLSESRT